MQTHLDLSYLPCVNSVLCAISFALLFICASMHTILWKQCCVLISYILTINTKFMNRFVHINHPIISSWFAKINDYPLNNIILLKKKLFSVVACQRYLCPNVIPLTMNVFIFRNLSLKTVFIEPYVKINYSLLLSLSLHLLQ